jgi:hypothetical protein
LLRELSLELAKNVFLDLRLLVILHFNLVLVLQLILV